MVILFTAFPGRMYRYFNPKGGKVKASAETMNMYKTEEGRSLDA